MTLTTHVQRTAVVTGAAHGIGAAVASRRAGDGLAVGVIDLDETDRADTVEAITSVGGAALAVAADIAAEAAVTAVVARIAAAFGPPTVLVNSAGIKPRANLVNLTTQQWDTVLGINLSAPFFTARAVCPHMMTAGSGRIVNTADISAVGDAGGVDYTSAKAGWLGFTPSLTLQLGPHGVTANTFEELRYRAEQSIPAGRVGLPDDNAHTASFLNSGAGIDSGQVIHVAAGRWTHG